MSIFCPEDSMGASTERDVYRELAEYKLSLLVAEQRLEMMTRMCNQYMEMRASVCTQLDSLGYTLTVDNRITENLK